LIFDKNFVSRGKEVESFNIAKGGVTYLLSLNIFLPYLNDYQYFANHKEGKIV